MAGIGVKLQKIFDKKSIAAFGRFCLQYDLYGCTDVRCHWQYHADELCARIRHVKLCETRPFLGNDTVYFYLFPVDSCSVQCGTVALYVGCDL